MKDFNSQEVRGTPITKEEALSILINKTGIITGGGYTLLPDLYCAQGSAPGCFRGGKHTSLNEHVNQWYRLTLRELIIKKSFFPDPFMLSILTNLQSELDDETIDLTKMVKFCIDGPFTAEQLIHDGDFGNSKIWWDYFNNCVTRKEAMMSLEMASIPMVSISRSEKIAVPDYILSQRKILLEYVRNNAFNLMLINPNMDLDIKSSFPELKDIPFESLRILFENEYFVHAKCLKAVYVAYFNPNGSHYEIFLDKELKENVTEIATFVSRNVSILSSTGKICYLRDKVNPFNYHPSVSEYTSHLIEIFKSPYQHTDINALPEESKLSI